MIELSKQQENENGQPWISLSWKFIRIHNELNVVAFCKQGHPIYLGRHIIAHNGIVSPALICTNCDFHDHVKLLNWTQ